MDKREKIKFMRLVSDAGVINAQATAQLDLMAIKNEFGHNLNTILITNNAAEELILILDGRQVGHIKGNGTVFGLDWEDGIVFSDVQLMNNDAANATAANEIRVTVGRTGV